jgi:hypothetical protein
MTQCDTAHGPYKTRFGSCGWASHAERISPIALEMMLHGYD